MLLNVENACFSYKKGTPVIKNLSFSADKGDLIAIIGPNGSGKTTLLRCIMGFLKFTQGKSELGGKDVRKIPASQFWNRVSYVPQLKGSYSSFTVGEMILLGLTSKVGVFSTPGRNSENKVVEIAERLGIKHLLEKKCNEISGGEYQMVLIARALVSEPELLILDEPESNLDFKNQLIVLDTLTKLSESGMCVIFNTHYPEHALTRANKSLILKKGGEAFFGETEKIVTEENIRRAFGVNVAISETYAGGNTYKNIIPLGLSDD